MLIGRSFFCYCMDCERPQYLRNHDYCSECGSYGVKGSVIVPLGVLVIGDEESV